MTGAKVKALRKKSGLAQKDLAIKLDVSVSTLQSWEQGRRTPTPEHIEMLIALVPKDMDVDAIEDDGVVSKPSKELTLGIIEQAEQTYLKACKEHGCDPNVGIMHSLMRTPSKPCWLKNWGKGITYKQNDDGDWKRG